MTITDFRFYFFSQTSFVTSFEKSFSVFFVYFSKLFLNPHLDKTRTLRYHTRGLNRNTKENAQNTFMVKTG